MTNNGEALDAHEGDVAILSYAALKAAILAGADLGLLRHLLGACEACGAAASDMRRENLSDVRIFVLAALGATVHSTPNTMLLDSLLDSLRQIDDEPLWEGENPLDGFTSVA